jgi:hypothetical protein
MGLFRALGFSPTRWASSDCITCKGTGYFGIDSIEPCPCTYRNFGMAGAAASRAAEEREQLDTMTPYVETPDDMRRRFGLDREVAPPNPVTFTEGQQEQKQLEARFRRTLSPEQRLAIAEGKLTMCCGASQCRCGVDHWRDTEGIPEPPTEEPARTAWIRWRDHVMALPRPQQQVSKIEAEYRRRMGYR